MVRVPLYVGRSIPHQKGRLPHPSFQHGGYLPISLPPFYLALPTMTQFCDWSHPSWGSLSASVNRYRHHSLCLPYMFLPKSAVKSHYQWSSPSLVDALVDIHGRSHNFPFFHPREALLVGHWVTALPLSSCGALFSSPLTEVVLCGVGLGHLSHVSWLPIHKGTPISDARRRSWFWWRTHDHLYWFVTS